MLRGITCSECEATWCYESQLWFHQVFANKNFFPYLRSSVLLLIMLAPRGNATLNFLRVLIDGLCRVASSWIPGSRTSWQKTVHCVKWSLLFNSTGSGFNALADRCITNNITNLDRNGVNCLHWCVQASLWSRNGRFTLGLSWTFRKSASKHFCQMKNFIHSFISLRRVWIKAATIKERSNTTQYVLPPSCRNVRWQLSCCKLDTSLGFLSCSPLTLLQILL